jgi:hypothetical protein
VVECEPDPLPVEDLVDVPLDADGEEDVAGAELAAADGVAVGVAVAVGMAFDEEGGPD